MLRSPLLHFLVLGGLLFALESIPARAPNRPLVEVRRSDLRAQIELFQRQTARSPSERERAALADQVIERALWLEEARTIGLLQQDPVVRRRLLMNMRFLAGDSPDPDAELLARARALGLDRSDPVVQRRLVDRMQALVRGPVETRPIDEAELARHHQETSTRWREPPGLDLTHVYLSRDKRGDGLTHDAEELVARLRRTRMTPEDAALQGDPFLIGNRLHAATPVQLVARLGPAFEAGVREAPVGRWLGPIESAFGLHAVWIHTRTPERQPPLAEIRDRVVADWREAESRRALQAHIEGRRAAVELRFIEDDPVDAERPTLSGIPPPPPAAKASPRS